MSDDDSLDRPDSDEPPPLRPRRPGPRFEAPHSIDDEEDADFDDDFDEEFIYDQDDDELDDDLADEVPVEVIDDEIDEDFEDEVEDVIEIDPEAVVDPDEPPVRKPSRRGDREPHIAIRAAQAFGHSLAVPGRERMRGEGRAVRRSDRTAKRVAWRERSLNAFLATTLIFLTSPRMLPALARMLFFADFVIATINSTISTPCRSGVCDALASGLVIAGLT